MKDIIVCEKPDEISFEEIRELLHSAHSINQGEKGFHVGILNKSADELEKHIGENGKCFVALEGDKLIGTMSYRIVERNYWCAKGRMIDRMMVAVHPDYMRRHISSMLFSAILEDIKEHGFNYVETRTAEKNKAMRKVCENEGFRYIGFSVPKTDHYNVVMLKWLNGCPYPKWVTNIQFGVRKIILKLKYKPGHVNRFSK